MYFQAGQREFLWCIMSWLLFFGAAPGPSSMIIFPFLPKDTLCCPVLIISVDTKIHHFAILPTPHWFSTYLVPTTYSLPLIIECLMHPISET